MKILSKFELDGDIVFLVAISVEKIKNEKGIPESSSLSVEEVTDDDIKVCLKKIITSSVGEL